MWQTNQELCMFLYTYINTYIYIYIYIIYIYIYAFTHNYKVLHSDPISISKQQYFLSSTCPWVGHPVPQSCLNL